MGTRGCVGFRKNGRDYLQYNHCDSYPDELGRQALRYLASHTPAQMAAVISRLKVVSENYSPTPEEIEAHLDSLDANVRSGSPSEAYVLLRDAQGNLAYYDDPKHVLWIDSVGFMGDSLFCEWAYVINLDEGILEVYKGFNKDPQAPGRYAAMHRNGEYWGVALIKTYPLSMLPSGNRLVAECDTPD